MRGWHSLNGERLGRPRLGFVCTGQTVDGKPVLVIGSDVWADGAEDAARRAAVREAFENRRPTCINVEVDLRPIPPEVSMLMVHHYLDHDADSAARPRKVTTIVWLGLERGRHRRLGHHRADRHHHPGRREAAESHRGGPLPGDRHRARPTPWQRL